MVQSAASKASACNEPDVTTAPLTFAGQAFLADKSGALFWPDQNTLIVADLHFEKGSHVAARGLGFPPPFDTRVTLARLADAITRYAPDSVIALGDSLHDVYAAARMSEDDLACLHALQADRKWWWVTGNHDPEIPACLGGHSAAALTLGPITFRHEPTRGPTPEIAAHFHPAARVAVRGQSLRRPCFVANRDNLIMPAFGAYTGGLNVLDAAFASIFEATDFQTWVIGHEGVYPVASAQLRGE